MPPKQKITSAAIVKEGYELTREEGIEAVNARSLARRLHCSTQPIFSQFTTIESLKKNVHNYACEKFEAQVLSHKSSDHFLRASYLEVIHLAKEEKNIFSLIYLSKYCIGNDLMTTRMQYESNQLILKEIEERYHLNKNKAEDILLRVSLLVQGIATMIATSNLQFSTEEVISIVERTINDMVLGYGKGD